MKHPKHLMLAAMVCAMFCAPTVHAVTTIFFNAAQTTNPVASGATSETISSSGYLFTYSLDKWWSATGSGPPTGRFQSILWPAGLDAQTQTAGPSGPLTTQIPATITIKRIDGLPFDLTTFTGEILGNTAGAGAAFEIMPLLNGNDGFANPLTLDATGYAGRSFTYITPSLTGFDTYNISLWMDFALTSVTLVDASLPPTLQVSSAPLNHVNLSWPTNYTGFTLQWNSSLSTTNWTSMTNTVNAVGASCEISIPATNGVRFFRLMQP
jgi:hypothetical protein